jgi:TonB family protein
MKPAAPAATLGAQAESTAAHGLGMAAETGVTVGNTDPALAYYFVLIQNKITGNWTPPKMGAGTTAGAGVSLRILRSGQLRDLAIDASSGDRALDDSALRAVRLSAPLPPLPPLFKAETLYLQLRFTFVGEKS